MFLDKAIAVPYGQIGDDEVRWLAEHAEHRQKLVELGSWTGKSTRALVDNTPGEVWAVDTWRMKEIHPTLQTFMKSDDWAFEEFMKNLGDAKNLRVVRQTSLEAAHSLQSLAPFDMVFIDADHSYEAVKADILAWQPLLSSDGLLCGHDYYPTEPTWCGVGKALEELFPHINLMSGTSIWWI